MASASPDTAALPNDRPAAAARINSHDTPPPSRKTSASTQLPKRAHTFQNDGTVRPDAFETSQDADDHDESADHGRGSVDLDELPIELVTLTDSFIESLSAKVHSTPPSITKLSQLFQDFYALSSSHVQTHISALATRQQRRGPSPSPSSSSSLSSAASRLRARTASFKATKDSSKSREDAEQQQMITTEELANRKKARRALEAQKGRLEEAVERRVCEAIYGRIYRHRSTQDEAQDDKLRSKTAALALVNIGLTDLGIDLGQNDDKRDGGTTFRDEEIRQYLESARKELIAMTDSHYPLGKINHLKAVHKSIVDTLSHFQPSASADEIMPMLIYTLITLAPEHLHAISDLHFMQSFRWEPKLTGEAAYCLTNFEAAISFLETVDLSTLRDDEHPSGPPKGSAASPAAAAEATRPETFPPAYNQAGAASTEASQETATAARPSGGGLTAAAVLRNRRLSDLVNTPAQAFGAASGAVFSTADQGLKTISSSLGESYSFLVGKLRQQAAAEPIAVPRTLDDARKLVTTPPLGDDDDDTASLDSATTATPTDDGSTKPVVPPTGRRDSVLALIGGRREPSADSTRSRRSASSLKKSTPPPPPTTVAGAAQQQGAAMLDQVRNLGSSFNPMARLPSMGFRGFGRPAASTPPVVATKGEDGGDLSAAFPDLAAALPPKQIPRIAPPNKRFMEISTPGELRLGEVLDLLRDYRRLAGALKNLDAFEDS
ncbi:VPS9 domain protein [Cordyceps militaris CM01]|uniref:VPS9 domain protein n=1 Tax=Cordyceps militaris (strain CM01) TaxID=983644 RepID=G3J5B9_CORMM|nr:VPS9 domain protein [Cordyceps militaris CM01]EGX96829.1 VPS9 domain protein [Cordyceps militaris CM01]